MNNMNKVYEINEFSYELIKNYKDGFELEVVQAYYTDYFENFDYLVGDWSYGKLRLKGFCSKTNPNYRSLNDINFVEKYIKELCSYDCRYFILKKVVE